jgi:hypothetical protein
MCEKIMVMIKVGWLRNNLKVNGTKWEVFPSITIPHAPVKFSKSTQWCIQLGYANKHKIENENLWW